VRFEVDEDLNILFYIVYVLIHHRICSCPKRTVLITGCSEDGMSTALAIAFYEVNLHVCARARDLSKMTQKMN